MEVRCPQCGHTAHHAFRTRDYNRRVTNEAFDYDRCPHCGLLFLVNVPDDLAPYYPDGYHPIPRSLGELDRLAEALRYQIDLVQRFVPSGRLLDIGPSYGAFAHLAKKAGFEVGTIEMDERCCRYLRDVVGVEAIQSDDPAAELLRLPPQQAITLWHVIEHLADPWLCLRRAADLLTPGGVLVVAAPNPQSLQLRIFRSRWVHVDAPRHLQLIPAPLLTERLREWGLESVVVTFNDEGSQLVDRAGWTCSIGSVAQRAPSSAARRAIWRLGQVVRPIVGPREGAGSNGGAYTIVARKAEGVG